MKIGFSSYSFAGAMTDGRLDLAGVVDWAAQHGASHLEIAEAGLPEPLTVESARALRAAAEAAGLPIINYVVAADFRGTEPAAEVDRIRGQLDIAQALGAQFFRHDVVEWAWREASQAELESVLATIVPACQQIADYAAGLGITTSVENHGFFMNHSERIARLLHLVDRDNFKTTLDVGNFLCVDDSPYAAVAKLAPNASVVHLKDFFIRENFPGEGWLETVAGNFLQGSVLGFGDLDLARILWTAKEAGFDGFLSIEYEGAQDCLVACELALANARRLVAELEADVAGVPA
ncbi:sugar phosphate isomerase/epimerase family protein [Arthrobacter russicus]|jgi:sugar phosphate isomerase/epimerase|uniref:Sugar phosphate isomerase/epimerase n=1 Tax=Arthrobacter russicus TaxID=172040 RepID=A0ABU1JFJ2_9MICC|nr:TIM barrel protein [Arthrobacter russicus]MDN5668008.1 sugar phosphate isomerase/epimerase [Renibacterium salmoninarum]MDR6270152.1 sugar phosphate isomerase/epimerase [Arthrobacter russicus]